MGFQPKWLLFHSVTSEAPAFVIWAGVNKKKSPRLKKNKLDSSFMLEDKMNIKKIMEIFSQAKEFKVLLQSQREKALFAKPDNLSLLRGPTQ